MRRLRRSSKNLSSGDAAVDARHQALVGIVNDFSTSLQNTEHCQDMNEAYDDWVGMTEERLQAARHGAWEEAQADQQMQEFLAERIPLPARDGPACKDCDLCDDMAHSVTEWLGNAGQHEQNQSPSQP